MTPEVPISHHLDLFSYWLSKRNGRIMPARRDIEPGGVDRTRRLHLLEVRKLLTAGLDEVDVSVQPRGDDDGSSKHRHRGLRQRCREGRSR